MALTEAQRKEIRMTLSGQDEEPVSLQTDPSEDEETTDIDPQQNGEMSHHHHHEEKKSGIQRDGSVYISPKHFLDICKALYPTEFNHVLAECKSQVYQAELGNTLQIISQLTEGEENGGS